ncbi:MAG TPA: tripartite tricarboxylate transporter substrate-binding protein [Xanthobacteraceae bacterium]|jgi:tripartite-type tricarboxylate transporter receptor subunit TctC
MFRICGVVLLALAGQLASGPAAAQLLSGRPITVVIPFTPGGSSDTLQRIVNRKVSDLTGQTLLVESRPGGAGAVGAAAVKQAAPDGHTLFQANAGTHAANPALYASLPYDPVKDFRPVSLMWSFANLLAVPADSPARTVADLIALAKAKPEGLSFASQGTGSGGHLLGEMLKARTGAGMVHVPYRGAGPAALDLAAGRVDFFFVSYSSLLPVLQTGKVRVIAVTSPQRMPQLADVPTMEESGFSGIRLDPWFGLVAPAATPDAVVEKLNAVFVEAVRDSRILRQLSDQGAEPIGSTPAQFAAFIAAQMQEYSALVKSVGVRMQ